MTSKALILVAHGMTVCASAILLCIATTDFIQFRHTHNLEQGIEALFGVGISIWFLGMHLVTKPNPEKEIPSPAKPIQHEETELRASGYKCEHCGEILAFNHSEMLRHNCVGRF